MRILKVVLVGVVVIAVAAVLPLLSVSQQSVQAAGSLKDELEVIQKSIADSKVPNEVKQAAANSKNPTYGKVYSLWPMSSGTFYFAISTPKGAVAFTFQTGNLTADAMLKVLLFAYEKQVPIWVFEDLEKPQVAASVVTITP